MEIREKMLYLAEATALHEPLGDSEHLIQQDQYVLFIGQSDHPNFNTVQHLRLSMDSIERTVKTVRQQALQHKRSVLTWEVASSATPPDLVEHLLNQGMTRSNIPLAVVMGLSEPPPQPLPEVVVSCVETLEDYRTFVGITHEVFGIQERLPETFIHIERHGLNDLAEKRFVRYIAWLNDEPVAAATATFTKWGAILHSGSTKVEARGQGAYRALVSARWNDAVDRGTPMVVTRAGSMSQPILQQMGFQELAKIEFLIDDFTKVDLLE